MGYDYLYSCLRVGCSLPLYSLPWWICQFRRGGNSTRHHFDFHCYRDKNIRVRARSNDGVTHNFSCNKLSSWSILSTILNSARTGIGEVDTGRMVCLLLHLGCHHRIFSLLAGAGWFSNACSLFIALICLAWFTVSSLVSLSERQGTSLSVIMGREGDWLPNKRVSYLRWIWECVTSYAGWPYNKWQKNNYT